MIGLELIEMPDDNELPTQSAPDETPSHLMMLRFRTLGYQKYVSGLKRGKTSGISDVFGSAEDFFADDVEIEPAPRLDLFTLEPVGAEDYKRRAIFFAHFMRISCRDFLRDHICDCQEGAYGPEIKKQALLFDSDELFNDSLKELSGVSVYLTVLEQGVLEDESNWLQGFLSSSLNILDRMVVGPSLIAIMEKYDYFEIPKVCQKAATSIGDRLDLGLLGDSAWSSVRRFLLTSGQARHDFLKVSLCDDPESIAEQIAQID
jgi:hypothetical protein